MKARILELLITPENIVNEDLQMLKDEIAMQPYAQSLRALYLLGTKKYDSENFQKVLSTTAAYTTDKKILYQFINGKIYEPKSEEIISEVPTLKDEVAPIFINEEKIAAENEIVENTIIKNKIASEGNWLAEVPEKEVPEKVVLDGAVNRILFPGEENFLNEEATEKIDQEASAESGVLVTEKLEDVLDDNTQDKVVAEKSPEEFMKDMLSLKSGKLESETEKILVKEEIKPEISVENRISENVENTIEVEKPSINTEKTLENKYEIARKKLAEEIERKMSHSKKSAKISIEEEGFEEENATVDFFHSQEFTFKNNAPKVYDIIDTEPETEKVVSDSDISITENSTENIVDENNDWKPMNSSGTTSSRFKREENATNKIQAETSEIINEEKHLEIEKPQLIIDDKLNEKEVPALDISFFTPEISQIKTSELKEATPELPKSSVEVEKSNVPGFINTWQNWLKIDRSEEKAIEKIEIPKENAKSEIIDKFIDTAPKISKFKEDGTFQVQEKKDDISHLMTETLAKLFLSQNLYSKAINAYKILKEKHPEKAAYFDEKILEIKESRQK